MSLQTLGPSSDWLLLIQPPPAAELLAYVRQKWSEFEQIYGTEGEPLSTRSEPVLTKGLGAFLDEERERGNQPFQGRFFAELCRFALNPDGTPVTLARTDIEWQLEGVADFVIEFKVIGGGRPASAYVTEGIARFVAGRYAPRSSEGAMWAFIRPHSSEGIPHVEACIDDQAISLRCQQENGLHRFSPSQIAPGVAAFDSLHSRDHPAQAIRLAHIFVDIVPSGPV